MIEKLAQYVEIGRAIFDAIAAVAMGKSKDEALQHLSTARANLNTLITDIEAEQAVDEAIENRIADGE